MPDITVDLSNTNLSQDPLPPGLYVAEVSKCEQQPSKRSGQPTVYWQFRIITPEEHAGRVAFHSTSLQPQANFGLGRVLLACGYPEEKLKVSGGITFDPDRLIGIKVGLVMQEDVFEGKARTKVVSVLPVAELQQQQPAM